jgi:drug/metabolite transporter (DMT)-like permease
MKTLRIIVAWVVIAGVATSALAGDLQTSAAKATKQPSQNKPETSGSKPMPRSYLWAGTALFVGGMAVGVYAFLNNRNGDFPGINEATATNKPLGAAGLGVAFVGGTILFLGQRKAKQSAELKVVPGGLAVTKTMTW